MGRIMEQEFHKIKRLPPYVFAEVNSMKARARAAEDDIIDLGMGNPDMPPAPARAAITLSALYEKPYYMHGSIGPSAAMALFEDGRMSVWTHSQGIYILRTSMAEALGMDEDNLRLIHTPGAGCYGHNGADDAALDSGALPALKTLYLQKIPASPAARAAVRRDDVVTWAS